MIGGIVVATKVMENRIWVNTVEKGENRNEKCAIYVERNSVSEKIKPGDSLWWQGGNAMWTPFKNCGWNRPKDAPAQKGGIDYDIRIPRIGFSGVLKP